MSGNKQPGPDADAFDMDLEPTPKAEVIDAEEDEDAARKREAALASTFDQERAQFGKSEEELVAERDAETRGLIDAAIVVGVAVAVIDAQDVEQTESDAIAADEFGGGDK